MIEIFKIGGNVIDDPEKLESFLAGFASRPGRKILVHGGGKEATRLAEKTGLEVTMVDGRRVTDKKMLDIVVMTYAGSINKRIVSSLCRKGCNALGLCGADADMVFSEIRPKQPIDFGYVGDPVAVRTDRVLALLDSGFVPVFAPITSSVHGLLNTNADTVAQTIAVALAEHDSVDLKYHFEKRGVLLDVNNPDSLLANVTPQLFEKLKAEGKITDGMLPKLQNAISAVKAGVSHVCIGETVISE